MVVIIIDNPGRSPLVCTSLSRLRRVYFTKSEVPVTLLMGTAYDSVL